MPPFLLPLPLLPLILLNIPIPEPPPLLDSNIRDAITHRRSPLSGPHKRQRRHKAQAHKVLRPGHHGPRAQRPAPTLARHPDKRLVAHRLREHGLERAAHALQHDALPLEEVGHVAAEEAGAAVRAGLGVEHDEGVRGPGPGDFVAGGGDAEQEELVAFVDCPVEEGVEGLRGWGGCRGGGDGGDVGCG